MTRDEFRGVARLLAASWPAAGALKPDAYAAAWDVLGAMTLEPVLTAIRTFVRDGERFQPTAGQIYRRVLDLDDDSPEWEWAWMELSRQVRTQGPLKTPAEIPWSHPLIAETATTCGWQEMCDQARDQAWQGFVQRVYEVLREERRRRERYAGLPVCQRPMLLTGGVTQADGQRYTDPADFGL